LSRGIATELLFDHLAIERGLVVSRPLFDVRYDRIVDNGSNLVRVQIKETSRADKGGWWVQTSDRNKKVYGDSIDVMAVYIKPEKAWFFFPGHEITASAMKLTLAGKHLNYLNNWEVFHEKIEKDKDQTV